jgi:hypothetical protein
MKSGLAQTLGDGGRSLMTAGSHGQWKKRNERLGWLATLCFAALVAYAPAQQDNGIHVGSPSRPSFTITGLPVSALTTQPR